MKKVKKLSIIISLSIFAFIAGIFLSGQDTGSTKYFSIPACSLQPTNCSYDPNDYWFRDQDTFSWSTAYSERASQIVYAPVHLPHGAKVTKLTAIVRDTSDGYYEYITVYLARSSPLSGLLETMAQVTTKYLVSSPSRREISSSSIASNKVDNSLYTYILCVYFGYARSTLKFHGAYISYQ